ncbi:MAG TPA: hypothetical protein VFN76_00560, partial [Candidatus Limnocylindria bacterium]|nr:hypothetical protein [Candidatus Limnocylindria bacterium]
MPTTAAGPRDARVGDLLPLERSRARRIDATALLIPGTADTIAYTDALAARADDFAAWDGRVAVCPPDGSERHRLLIIDRYGQVYEVHDAPTTDELPDADALEEWFRFLATACPECGVIDDPV